MYIIRTLSKSQSDTKKRYYTYRLMESIRIGKKVKKRTLLNLGSDFAVAQDRWAQLASRIDDILHRRESLFALDDDLESLAQQYALRILSRDMRKESDRSQSSDNSEERERYLEIAPSTLQNSDPKSVGIEHLAYETLRALAFEEKLQSLGLKSRERHSALGTIIAKMAQPASDAKTYRWLCSASAANELLGCDFNTFSSNNIYRIADRLLEHKEELETHLYQKQKALFAYEETLTLYDLTNTYFEGQAQGNPKAKRGRSKEKRSDAPLVTLALVLDGSGFVKRSEFFEGDISEPSTFQTMIEAINPDRREDLCDHKASLVVMDAGIATEENIDYLKHRGYEYIVVSRKRKQCFDAAQAVTVKRDDKEQSLVEAYRLFNPQTEEVELYIHSKPREAKEEAMLTRVQTLFEEKLSSLKEGLSIKRRTKEYAKVIEAIGRLKEKYPSIAHHYAITVIKDPQSTRAKDILWQKKKSLDDKSASNGIYCLRSNNTTMDEATMWKSYTRLTDLEAVFRSLKSELGLRPIYHRKQSRVDAHLFITLLAYSVVHTIRYKLKRKGIHYSWETIREIFANRVRITTSMKCKNHTTLYIRQSSELNEAQKEIYDALGIAYQAGKVVRRVL